MKPKAPRSLQSRALQLLAQREQSRVELCRKLLVHALAEDTAMLGTEAKAGADTDTDTDSAAVAGDAATRVDAVLAWLDSHRFLSDERFVESRVNARVDRFGDLRIRQELKQHGVALDANAAKALRESEGARARAVWERRFGSALPTTPAESARQARFLTARGFSPDAVRSVLRHARGLRTTSEPGTFEAG